MQQGIVSAGLTGGPTVSNCIIRGNVHPQVMSVAGTYQHCNIEGGWPGPGNIDLDPMFADPMNGDFRLTKDSPCIDAGTNLPNLSATDLDGNPRIIGGTVDMGPFEFGEACWLGNVTGGTGGLPFSPIQINGSSGAVVKVNANETVTLCGDNPVKTEWNVKESGARMWGHVQQDEHFVQCLLEGRQPSIAPADGRIAMEIATQIAKT